MEYSITISLKLIQALDIMDTDQAIEMLCRNANANDEVLKIVVQYFRQQYPQFPEWMCRNLFKSCTRNDRVNIAQIFFSKNDSPNGQGSKIATENDCQMQGTGQQEEQLGMSFMREEELRKKIKEERMETD